jgi:hypothetical protein
MTTCEIMWGQNLYLGHTWAGIRGQGKSREGCALTPTKPNCLRIYSTKFSNSESCSQRRWTFMTQPISIHAAQAVFERCAIILLSCMCASNAYFFLMLTINHMMGLHVCSFLPELHVILNSINLSCYSGVCLSVHLFSSILSLWPAVCLSLHVTSRCLDAMCIRAVGRGSAVCSIARTL